MRKLNNKLSGKTSEGEERQVAGKVPQFKRQVVGKLLQ